MKKGKKSGRKKLNLRFLFLAVSVVVLICGLAYSFVSYTGKTKTRIATQIREYAKTESSQTAKYITNVFNSSVQQVEVYTATMNRTGKVVIGSDYLEMLEKESKFDYFRYTDISGINYASNGDKSDATDRDYYLEGMQGQSGVSIIFDSRLTGETMIGFFAPLKTATGKVYGVLRGVYTADSYLATLLDSTLFGEAVYTYLCTNQGTIISSSDPMKPYGIVMNYLSNAGYMPSDSFSEIFGHMSRGSSTIIQAGEEYKAEYISVEPVMDGEFYLIQVFPNAIADSLTSTATYESHIMILSLVLIVVLFAFIMEIYFRAERRAVENENREMTYLTNGTASFGDWYVLVDLPANSYKYMFGNKPPVKRMSKSGSYAELAEIVEATAMKQEDRDIITNLIERDVVEENLIEAGNVMLQHIYETGTPENKRWASLYVVALETKFGRPTMVLFMSMDFTDIREKDLQNQRLLEAACEEAERANNAKSDFLANMSHEIRTPINAILGMNTMIMRESNLSEIKLHSLDIQSAGRALLSAINDILDYSKIESGKMELVPVDYDISSLLNDCYNIVLQRITEKDLDFIVEVDPELPKCLYGDEVRIRQILINILTNAAKYTKQGYVKLKAGSVHDDNGNFILKLAVEDSGIGIKEDSIDKLFTSFLRVDEKANRSIEGTGLGLAITKSFVDMMNGKITVESEYGKGSVFTVEIPQTVIDSTRIGEMHYDVKTEAEVDVYKEPFHAPNAHVLVVDDMELNLKVFVGLVKELQMDVDTASSGFIALNMLEKKKYDIVFMDHRMPDLDGVETLQRFMEEGSDLNKEVPFIALTANAVVGARDEYLAAGFKDYLSKPVKQDKLNETLDKYLDESLKIMPGIEGFVYAYENEAEGNAPKEEECKGDNTPVVDDELGLDEREGIANCGNKELFLQTVKSYVGTYKDMKESLEKFLDEGDTRNFAIKVHGLKSTSRLVGAMKLSEMALELENLGNEGDILALRDKAPALLRLYDSVVELMAEKYGLKEKEEEKPEIELPEFLEHLKSIKEANDSFAIDKIDEIMVKITKKKIPAKFVEDWEKLKSAIFDVDGEKIENIINKILSR